MGQRDGFLRRRDIQPRPRSRVRVLSLMCGSLRRKLGLVLRFELSLARSLGLRICGGLGRQLSLVLRSELSLTRRLRLSMSGSLGR